MRRDYRLMDVALAEALWLRFRRWGQPPSPHIALGERHGSPAMKWWGEWPVDARPDPRVPFSDVVVTET